jgi:hypothetical protein
MNRIRTGTLDYTTTLAAPEACSNMRSGFKYFLPGNIAQPNPAVLVPTELGSCILKNCTRVPSQTWDYRPSPPGRD